MPTPKAGTVTTDVKKAVEKLRETTKGYFDTIEELKKVEKRRELNQEKLKSSISFQQKLDELKNAFFEIASKAHPKKKKTSTNYAIGKFILIHH